jgi:hypothetical protein
MIEEMMTKALTGLDTPAQLKGGDPGTYIEYFDDSGIQPEPSRTVGCFVVETDRGYVGRRKIRSIDQYRRMYGHNPMLSTSCFGPLNHLRYSNSAQVVRATGGATAGVAVLATIPADDTAPEEFVRRTMLLPALVGEQGDPKDVRMSDDMAVAFVSLHPGTLRVEIRLEPHFESPLGGFKVFVHSALGEEYHHVTFKHRQDGYNSQMHIEERINSKSEVINVFVNPNFVDELVDELIDVPMKVVLGGAVAGSKVDDVEVIDCMQHFIDKDACLADLIVQNGWTSPLISNIMDGITQYRQDCMALHDVPLALAGNREEIILYREERLALDSPLSTLYVDWLNVRDPVTRSVLVVPGSAIAAGCYAYTDITDMPTASPAGKRRGALERFGVIDTYKKSFDREDRHILARHQCNAVRKIDEDGMYIWLDATTQKLESVQSFIGPVRLRLKLHKRIVAISEEYHFDVQNEVYQRSVEAGIRDLLKKEQMSKTISTYSVSWTAKNTLAENMRGVVYLRIEYTAMATNRQMFIDCHLTSTGVYTLYQGEGQ